MIHRIQQWNYLLPPLLMDSKDLGEVALRNDNKEKRKGKHHDLPSKEEHRNSLRVRLNQLAGAKEVSVGFWGYQIPFRLKLRKDCKTKKKFTSNSSRGLKGYAEKTTEIVHLQSFIARTF